MIRSRSYKRRRPFRASRFTGGKYVRVVGIILVIVTVASFYIYQRVWVRNLVGEISRLEDHNETAGLYLAAVKSEWMAASSMSNIEIRINDLKLDLIPSIPSQNYTLSPPNDQGRSRYAGLVKAFESLKGNIPLVSSNEADASELFDAK